jgi:hypothetical protein
MVIAPTIHLNSFNTYGTTTLSFSDIHHTHVLQGLDVVCFAKVKEEFQEKIHRFEDLHMAGVTKANFTSVFRCAFKHAFTSDSIKAAFAATGAYPFNPDVISEK